MEISHIFATVLGLGDTKINFLLFGGNCFCWRRCGVIGEFSDGPNNGMGINDRLYVHSYFWEKQILFLCCEF